MNRPESAAASQQTLQFERRLALVFVPLGTFLTLLMTAYWFLVQEPTLHIHAASHSHALAQAQALGIERLLRDRDDPQRLRNDIQTDLAAILLPRDRSAETTVNDSLSIVLFDLDGFKRINDTCGHRVGDDVLIATAAALKASVRNTDIVGRYGG